MSDFEVMIVSDILLVGALCIARYVFGYECFEWYVPAFVMRWLESGVQDLTDGVYFYQEKI